MVASLDSSTENLTKSTKSYDTGCSGRTRHFELRTSMPVIFDCPRLKNFVVEGEREIGVIGSKDVILVDVDW